jgi:hypothetical protein
MGSADGCTSHAGHRITNARRASLLINALVYWVRYFVKVMTKVRHTNERE